MRPLARLFIVAFLLTACSQPPPEQEAPPGSPNDRPVSGRTSTGAGLSVDFPEGWRQVPLHGPFTRSYENRDARLNFDLSGFGAGGSLSVMGEHMRQDLGREGTVVRSGNRKIDGNDAVEVLLEKRTSSGHGLVHGLVIARPDGKFTSVFLSSRSDEHPTHRDTIEALISTFKME